ncbi:hypothetical protein H4R19_004625, partial [Coemansia spiralis]
SNTVLRGELGSARGRLRDTEAALARVQDQEVPHLRSANAALQAELDAARDHARQLQDQCDHWKQRHEAVLARHQLVEPEELEALKQESTRLATELDALRLENQRLQDQAASAAEQKSAATTRRATQLQNQVTRLAAQVSALQAELAAARDRDSQHQAELAAAQDASQTATRDAHDQKAKFDKLHTTFQRLRTQSVAKLEQCNALIVAHEATIADLRASIDAGPATGQSQLQPAVAPSAPAGDVDALQAEIAELALAKDEAVAAQQRLAEELHQAAADLDSARAEISQKQQQQPSSAGDAPVPAVANGDDAAQADYDKLRADLAASEARVAGLEAQLEQVKAKARKYASDNRVLQARVAELQAKVQELSAGDLQTQLAELKKQLADADARVEAAQVNAAKKAELRSRLQISRANKRADDLEKQVTDMQARVSASAASDDPASLKRPADPAAAPAKKPHVDQ